MNRAARERLRIGAPLALLSLAAWLLLVWRPLAMTVPAFCSGQKDWAVVAVASSWRATANLMASILALNPPATIARAWALMFVAMMAPLLLHPLTHIFSRSLRARRGRSMLEFVAGYVVVWMAVGAALVMLALFLQAGMGALALPVALASVVLWQVSPAKQYCLNRCHNDPELAAFGPAADRDALRYGVRHAAWCAGGCWGFMLLPLLVEHLHQVAMLFGALWAFAERYERPAPLDWRWRRPEKLVRLVRGQLHASMRIRGRMSP